MKTILSFVAAVLLASAAVAQQGQMASNFTASGTAGAGYLQLANQSVAPNTPTSAGRIFFDSTNLFSWKNTGGFLGKIDLGGASRTITLSGSPTLDDWFNQSVKSSASPSFSGLTLNGTLNLTTSLNNLIITGTDGIIYRSGGNGTNAGAHRFRYFDADAAVVNAAGLAVTGNITGTFNGGTQEGGTFRDGADANGAAFMAFRTAGGVGIGSVTRVGVTSAVAYNTTSDGRLKTNIRDFTAENSGPIIDGLRPRWFDWKSGDCDAIGFIAQEENDVDPALARIGAVTVGDDDPEVITQQWQRSDAALIPIVIAEIKALRARVAELEGEVEELKSESENP